MFMHTFSHEKNIINKSKIMFKLLLLMFKLLLLAGSVVVLMFLIKMTLPSEKQVARLFESKIEHTDSLATYFNAKERAYARIYSDSDPNYSACNGHEGSNRFKSKGYHTKSSKVLSC